MRMLAGTATSIGGPPMALLYQYEEPARVRATRRRGALPRPGRSQPQAFQGCQLVPSK